MDEQTKRKMIKGYFKSFPKWAVMLIAIGLLVTLIGFADKPNAAPIIIGLIIVGAGGAGIYFYTQGKATEKQMDEWLAEDLKILQKQAINKFGIDASELKAKPVQVTGPRFWDIGGAPVLWKRGSDNILRFTPISVSVINFTENQLLAYNCVLDFTTGKALNEATDEYFYKDVVAVSTKSESMTVNINKKKFGTIQLNAAEVFTLTTSGGTSISVLLRDPTLINRMGGGEMPTTKAEEAIQAVRKMLRDKKV